jgi:nicotinamidase/pyrazinamidase
VGYSALDARTLGFKTVVVEEGCRAINLNGSADAMRHQFVALGIELR